jgi:hypothetical protein
MWFSALGNCVVSSILGKNIWKVAFVKFQMNCCSWKVGLVFVLLQALGNEVNNL